MKKILKSLEIEIPEIEPVKVTLTGITGEIYNENQPPEGWIRLSESDFWEFGSESRPDPEDGEVEEYERWLEIAIQKFLELNKIVRCEKNLFWRKK